MRNGLALAFGCVLVVLGVGIGEGVVRLVAPGRPPMREDVAPAYMEPHEVLGWRPRASLRSRTQKRMGERLVYDVTYTFDEHHRRVTPVDAPVDRRRFLLFFGCSHTFGEGLNDDETLPYFVSRLLPDTHVYNYAFRGYGPQHMLARIESSNLRREVAEPEGTAVYVLPPYQLDRLIGGSATMGWVADLPYYRLEHGEAIRDGFFQTTRPVYSFFARTLGRSRLMQKVGIAWPPRVRSADLELACAVYAKAKRLLDEQLGPTPLVVMLHPGGLFVDLDCLDPLGIPVLDHHAIFPEAAKAAMRIPIDGHTNARGNRMLAEQLVADLGRVRTFGGAPRGSPW